MEVVISSLTSTEAVHARMNTSRLNGVLSGPRVVPVGHEEARSASKLLMEAGLHGHEYAIDAAVAEAALRHHRPVAMLTSDLCVRGVEGQCPVAPDRDLGHVEPTALRTGRLP
ncbi:hypothetical protein [Streptomyces sp. NPDC018059]|uniref:hypothetical protein n=1 Tax=Streptomyces sp. NPDC018059 TaxID=3365041 RepID=UPI0037BBD178